MPWGGGGAGKIHRKAQQNVLTPSKENWKINNHSKCSFKNWLPPPPSPPPPKKRNVCKNKNTKRKLRLLSAWTSLHHYIELILFILSDILCSLSCAGTIINRQRIYHKRFLGYRKRSVILESSGICRNGRGANAKNAWKGANDGSRKDRWHAGSFQFFFCVRKTKWEFVFHSRVKSIGQR